MDAMAERQRVLTSKNETTETGEAGNQVDIEKSGLCNVFWDCCESCLKGVSVNAETT